jgi:hypothetical protein
VSKNNDYITYKKNNRFTVTPIKEDQFLVESNYKSLKIIAENEYSITYIDIEDGPILHIGKDFLGMGNISSLEIISTEEENYIIIKVTTNS